MDTNSSNSLLKRLLLNRNFLTVMILTAGILPALVNYGGFYLVGDGTLQELPFIYEAKRMLGSGAPWWSWHTFLGDNYIGSQSYYIFINVFALVNCLFPYKYLGLGLTLMLYLKFLLLAFVSDKYFRRMGFSKDLSVLGAILFTFSSWIICSQLYYFFMQPVIMFVVLLICIERWICGARFRHTLLALAVAGVFLTNFYFAPGVVIGCAIYFVCRLVCLGRRPSALFSDVARAAGCVALGAAISAVVVLPSVMFAASSERAAADTHIDWLNIAYRIVSVFLPSIIEGYTPLAIVHSGWNCNQACIAVFGLLPAALLILRRPRLWQSAWLFACLVCYVTPLNGVFLLFTSMQYSRWAFILTFAIVICTLSYFKEFGAIPLRSILIYSIVCLGIYAVLGGASWYIQLFRVRAPWSFTEWRLLAIGLLLAVNLCALAMLGMRKFPAKACSAAIFSVAVCSALQLLLFTLAHDDCSPLARDSSIGVSKYYVGNPLRLSSAPESSTSRTDFITYRPASCIYQNMGQLCGLPSVSTYNSLKSPLYHLMRSASAPGSQMNVFAPTANRTSFDALMSVSQVIEFHDPNSAEPLPEGIIPIEKTPEYTRYGFEHYIPMGFAYDTYMDEELAISRSMLHPLPDIPIAMLNALALDSVTADRLAPLLHNAGFRPDADIDSLVQRRRMHACHSFSPDTEGFTAEISLPEEMVVFFSVIADKGFTAYIDGIPTEIHPANLGLSAIVVPEGEHTIRFDYFPPWLLQGLIVSLAGLCILGGMALAEVRRKPSNS